VSKQGREQEFKRSDFSYGKLFSKKTNTVESIIVPYWSPLDVGRRAVCGLSPPWTDVSMGAPAAVFPDGVYRAV
jgi:hypothetical protein